MTRRHTRFALLGSGLLATVLAACSTGGAPPAGEPTEPENGETTADEVVDEADDEAVDDVYLEDPDVDDLEPEYGGTLRFLARLDADQIDPHVATDTTGIISGALVYEGLVENVRGEVQPLLAESWEISDDLLTYTFNLRDDVVFHSGRDFTAEDVVYSLERVMDPETLAPNSSSYASISAVEAVDEHTVDIVLERPHSPLLFLLSALSSSVVDREVVESTGLDAPPGGGTGPFMYEEHNVGRNLLLTAHEDYWHPELPYLDGIDFTFNPDDNARAAAIRSNSVDLLFSPAPEFIDSLMEDENLKWYGGSGSLSLHLLLNASREPFDDERVRQAIFLALDRQELLDVANQGLGMPLNGGYLPPDRWGAITEPVYGEPDIDRARELMAEAGYEDGFEAELTVIGSSAFQVRQAEVEQAQLAEIGIDITLNPVDAAVSREITASGDFDMYQSGFGLRADPDERFTAAFTTDGGLNYANWSDEEFDSLIEEARGVSSQEERAELYEQADRVLAERGPAAFTILTASYDVVWENVMGYRGDPTPSFSIYKHLWMEN
ncbi:ABC transporter substrate-binding protein [Bogoriella caseilytica]|uniref:Peptide/nickel transport system substrate-binding protein n=1 Tax=Bogoriella caseilytica TaxID=56055 RepID=A0A3N2BDI2_9MICO|nr:ABC transporter substrate-binding protein [Bogoriella caseilytica]ROR73302.1 peptide/nickel transport system substrate-binding protein [Bogoriella caseilytica]